MRIPIARLHPRFTVGSGDNEKPLARSLLGKRLARAVVSVLDGG
jgi:hypothetical protein